MLRIKSPASSANLGPGFDCLGLALALYDTFDVRLSSKTVLHNVEDRYNNADNLFLKAYRYGCEAIGVSDHVDVYFDCAVPSARGMGSSACFITAGITAASALHDHALSQDEIFQLISRMEGHPDNTAPCLFGGLTMSMRAENGTYLSRRIPLHEKWCFTLLIPDFEVSTKAAREALPVSVSRKTAADTCAHALLMSEALRSGDFSLLKQASADVLHEPYRRKLIDDYETVRNTVLADTDGAFLISGSGPACLLISENPLSEVCEETIRRKAVNKWQIIPAVCAEEGTITEVIPDE